MKRAAVYISGAVVCVATMIGIAPLPNVTLTPGSPEQYLTVGEDLVADAESRELGSEVLAVGALVSADNSPRLAASMIIALAGSADRAETFHGLWMLAVSLDPDRAGEYRWLAAGSGPTETDAAETARVLGQIRRNDPDGPRSITDAHRSRIIGEARQLGLDHRRAESVLAKWEHDAENDPCKGRLFVRKRDGDRIVLDACPLPAFHHNQFTDDDWRLMVAIELSLLGSQPETWEARIELGIDAPVPVWTLERLGQAYGVSADRPVLRGGRWSAR